MKRSIVLIGTLVLAGLGHATPVALSPGVLVDLAGEHAFAVDPDGFTQKLDLGNGAASWVSPEKAYPLVVADGLLVTLAAPDAPGSAVILLLDPGSGGVVDRVSFDLPESVSANFFPTPKRRFRAAARDTLEGVRIIWSQESRTLRGAAIVEIDAAGNEEINPGTVQQGAFDLVRDQERYYAIPVRTALAEPSPAPLALPAAARIPDLPGEQLRAADDRHVHVSEAVPHEQFGQVYRWSIHDRTGARKGGYTSPYAFAPFVASDDLLVIRDQPFGHAERGDRWVERGARLVVIDLASGTERWSFQVLDSEYRGPMPP